MAKILVSCKCGYHKEYGNLDTYIEDVPDSIAYCHICGKPATTMEMKENRGKKYYCFTEEQLFQFLAEWCDSKWHQDARKGLVKILEELAEKEQVHIRYLWDV